jgi:hypothetical protein
MEFRYATYIMKLRITEITIHVTMMTQFFWDVTATKWLLDLRSLLSFCMSIQSKNSILLAYFGTEDEGSTFL